MIRFIVGLFLVSFSLGCTAVKTGEPSADTSFSDTSPDDSLTDAPIEDSLSDAPIGDAWGDAREVDIGIDRQLVDLAVDLWKEDHVQPVDGSEDLAEIADAAVPDSTSSDVLAQQGDPCRTDNDCNDRFNHLVCISPSASQCSCTGGAQCGKDGDCDPGLVCDVLRPVWPCVRCYTSGMSCVAACTKHSECPLNHKCIDGHCLKKDCVTDDDCPPDFACQFAGKFCQRNYCLSDDECKAGPCVLNSCYHTTGYCSGVP